MVEAVRSRAREARESVRLDEDLRARHDATRLVVDDFAVERRGPRERNRDGLAFAEGQLHVRPASPPGLSGVDDDRAASLGRVRDRETSLGVRLDPARRRAGALEPHEGARGGSPAGAEHDARHRIACLDRDRTRNRARPETRLPRRRQPGLLDRDAVPRGARLFELELAVLAGDGLARHDAIREVVAAGDTRLERDRRARNRFARGVSGDSRKPLSARQRMFPEILDLRRVVDALEEHGDDARPLGPNPEQLLLARLGRRHRENEGPVRSARRRGDGLQRLAPLHLAPGLVSGRLPGNRGDRDTQGGPVGAVGDEDAAADFARARGSGQDEKRDERDDSTHEGRWGLDHGRSSKPF